MRIIGGELRRRNLETPKDAKTTRPMPDHVREAVFNLLRGHSEGEVVIDLFAGTGAVGLEAVSRGASRCVFVERDKQMVGVIERNIASLRVGERCEVVRADALGPLALARCPERTHLIFFDPPYPMVRDAKTWQRCRGQLAKLVQRLDDEGYLILRTPWPAIRRDREDPGDEPSVKRGKGRSGGRGPGKAPQEVEGEEMVELDFDEGGDWSINDWAGAEDLSGGRAEVEAIDLSIEGAVGPETHDYGKMAVHLYMRRR